MDRYLLYDAGCDACSTLAQAVAAAASGKLVTLPLREERAQALLTTAFPQGWRPAPYVVAVTGSQVRAWTGLGAASRLALLLGPHKAMRLWALARRAGAPAPPGMHAPGGWGAATSRRRVLRLGAAASTALAWAGLARTAQPIPVAAQPGPCSYPDCSYYLYSQCGYYCGCGICNCYWKDLQKYYDCYGAGGVYCGRYVNTWCCAACF